MTADHDRCAQVLRDGMAPIEITVSTRPPIVAGPFTTDPYTCPHNVTFWMEPTGEQLAEWAGEGSP